MIFTYVVIFLETGKNPKFEGLKINNGQDMANLLILQLWRFFSQVPLRDHVFFILIVHQECYWISEKYLCDHNGTRSSELSKTSKNQILINFKGL